MFTYLGCTNMVTLPFSTKDKGSTLKCKGKDAGFPQISCYSQALGGVVTGLGNNTGLSHMCRVGVIMADSKTWLGLVHRLATRACRIVTIARADFFWWQAAIVSVVSIAQCDIATCAGVLSPSADVTTHVDTLLIFALICRECVDIAMAAANTLLVRNKFRSTVNLNINLNINFLATIGLLW